jgi:hypothetical protein
MNRAAIILTKKVGSKILVLRNQKVILDTDLAELYGVPVKRLNEQVKRNPQRFPPDFLFTLTSPEYQELKSQNATASSTHGGRRYLPNAFTEHGAIMAAHSGAIIVKNRQTNHCRRNVRSQKVICG